MAHTLAVVSSVLLFSAALAPAAAAPASVLNDRPIVGVLSQPLGVEAAEVGAASSNATRQTYIAASYVKFLEQAGARVVPVHYDASEAELTALFGSINGLLLPGGGSDLKNTTRLHRAGKTLYDLAVKANDAGDFFPLWGTCMGFQFMALLTTEDPTILCHGCFDSDGDPLPLVFAEPAASQSGLFAAMTPQLKHQLATENLTENSHHAGIAPATFTSNTKLASFYDVLSTNVDYAGLPFVSTMEAKNYPFAATQWHPEKNNFEWGGIGKLGTKAIPHGPEATAVSQYMANFVVGEARKSGHRFPTPAAEDAALIYNDQPVKGPNGYFEQVYLWDERPSTEDPINKVLLPPAAPASNNTLFFYYKNPAFNRCGDVDAAPRMPASLFEPQNALELQMYITLTEQLYRVKGMDRPNPDLKLHQGRCKDHSYSTKLPYNTTAAWAPTKLMSAACDARCKCVYPACPDVPDDPNAQRWCSLCGPKYNAPIEIALWNPTG